MPRTVSTWPSQWGEAGEGGGPGLGLGGGPGSGLGWGARWPLAARLPHQVRASARAPPLPGLLGHCCQLAHPEGSTGAGAGTGTGRGRRTRAQAQAEAGGAWRRRGLAGLAGLCGVCATRVICYHEGRGQPLAGARAVGWAAIKDLLILLSPVDLKTPNAAPSCLGL